MIHTFIHEKTRNVGHMCQNTSDLMTLFCQGLFSEVGAIESAWEGVKSLMNQDLEPQHAPRTVKITEFLDMPTTDKGG